MRTYRTGCFVVALAICGFTVGCGGDSGTPSDGSAVDSAPVATEAPAGGSGAKPADAEPVSADAKPAGSGSK